MAVHDAFDTDEATIPAALRRFLKNRLFEFCGIALLVVIFAIALSLASWSIDDPSFNHATGQHPTNWLGSYGAIISDQLIQLLGLGVLVLIFAPLTWAAGLLRHEPISNPKSTFGFWIAATIAGCCLLAGLPKPSSWALVSGLGGSAGEIIMGGLLSLLSIGIKGNIAEILLFAVAASTFVWLLSHALGTSFAELSLTIQAFTRKPTPKARSNAREPKQEPTLTRFWTKFGPWFAWPSFATSQQSAGDDEDILSRFRPLSLRRSIQEDIATDEEDFSEDVAFVEEQPATRRPALKIAPRPKLKAQKKKFELPSLEYLAEPRKVGRLPELSKDQLEENARQLEGVLEDFGVKGQIINVRPGPVVTLYELEPAPGIKSSRVISLADDIARSMSAVSARVAVVAGRNVIGIELPNSKRETVYLRELFQGDNFIKNNTNLTLALGKNIGGEPIFADLARMPHLLIAGTTGSGKSVGINTMILSLLYRLPPEKCKLIMIDPKMLELSVYEGIPHLLAPVVTDPRKAVVALKWAVR